MPCLLRQKRAQHRIFDARLGWDGGSLGHAADIEQVRLSDIDTISKLHLR
jgi:hypothetical protein